MQTSTTTQARARKSTACGAASFLSSEHPCVASRVTFVHSLLAMMLDATSQTPKSWRRKWTASWRCAKYRSGRSSSKRSVISFYVTPSLIINSTFMAAQEPVYGMPQDGGATCGGYYTALLCLHSSLQFLILKGRLCRLM